MTVVMMVSAGTGHIDTHDVKSVSYCPLGRSWQGVRAGCDQASVHEQPERHGCRRRLG
jgi:hypothetical protein